MWSPWDKELNTAIAPSVASQSPALQGSHSHSCLGAEVPCGLLSRTLVTSNILFRLILPSGKEMMPGFQLRVISRLGMVHSGQFALRAPTKRISCAEGTGSVKC